MALGILLADIMGVVGADQRDACLLMETQKVTVHLRLLADAMILQFQIKVIRSEDLLHLQRILLGALIIAVQQPLRNFTCQACRQRN